MVGLIGHGIDLIEIDRIKAAGDRFGDRFWQRLFTREERSLAAAYRDAAPFYAGRFAAKEAVLKSLGTGLRQASWQDVEIIRGAKGEPIVRIHGELARQMQRIGVSRVLVSISHSRSHAVASAMAVRDFWETLPQLENAEG